MDFSLTPELLELQQRTRAFIRDKIIPLEGDGRQTHHGPTEEFRRELVALAAEAGLVAPHVGIEYGGLGLSHVGKAVVFEEAGYSLLGPVAMHIFAPDEGNMHLLEAVASTEQKDRWLRPLAAGETRSCFCMTEPRARRRLRPRRAEHHRGARTATNTSSTATSGSSPAPRARPSPSSWPRTRTATPRCSWPTWTRPGIEIVRAMDSLDHAFAGGHGVMRFNNLRVPASDILGEPGKGFRYAQVRLAPARLTHCMRWLGAARRAHQIATDYAREREVFGSKLIGHEGVGFMLADNEMDIRMSRLSIWHTAWMLDQGERGSHESSHGEGVLLRGDLPRGGSLRADAGRAGHHRRNGRRAHLPRDPRLPHLRRAVGGASLEHGAAHRPPTGPTDERHGHARLRPDRQGLHRHRRRPRHRPWHGRGAGPPRRHRGADRPHPRHAGGNRRRHRRAGVGLPGRVTKEPDIIALRDAVLASSAGSTSWSTTPGSTRSSRRIEKTTLEDWNHILDVNLTGLFLSCKYLGGAIGEGGSVINVSSIAGRGGLLRSTLVLRLEGRGGAVHQGAGAGLGEARGAGKCVGAGLGGY